MGTKWIMRYKYITVRMGVRGGWLTFMFERRTKRLKRVGCGKFAFHGGYIHPRYSGELGLGIEVREWLKENGRNIRNKNRLCYTDRG